MNLEKQKIIVFDTEDNSEGKIYWINFFDGVTHYPYKDRELAFDYLDKIDFDVLCFAVNLEYDLINLFGNRFSKCKRVVYSSKVIYAKYGKITFLDTLNHWQGVGVAKMGKFFNAEKLPFDPKNLKYCQKDCEITYRFVNEMLRVYYKLGITKIYSTIASTSFYFYEEHFRNYGVYRIKKDKLDYFKSFYLGGRCEMFRKGEFKNVSYVDVNSLYPYVMLNEYPYPFQSYESKEPINQFYIITAIVESNLKVPILPIKNKGYLIFPNGVFKGNFTSIEFEKFLELGGKIKRIDNVTNFPVSCKPFEKYINYLYPFKENSENKFERNVAKYLMNSLYGKFAQYKDISEVFSLEKYLSSEHKESVQILKDVVIQKKKGRIPFFTNFIFSVFVASYARLLLYEEMEKLKGNILYCDTDSIFYKGKTIHKESDKIGIFSLVDKYDTVEFKGLKFYKTFKNGKTAFTVKGIKKEGRKDYFEKGIATVKRPVKFRESLRVHDLFGKANHWLEFTKVDKRKYNKGYIENGKVFPFIMEYKNCKNIITTKQKGLF